MFSLCPEKRCIDVHMGVGMGRPLWDLNPDFFVFQKVISIVYGVDYQGI